MLGRLLGCDAWSSRGCACNSCEGWLQPRYVPAEGRRQQEWQRQQHRQQHRRQSPAKKRQQ